MADEASPPPTEEAAKAESSNGDVIGSAALRPVFFGNLIPNYATEAVIRVFEQPAHLKLKRAFQSFPVDRVDLKRGYCFVFLKDAKSQKDKDEVEEFLREINGM